MMPTNTTNMKTFAAADGLKLAYYVDDFTDPWRTPDTLVLLHAAMGERAQMVRLGAAARAPLSRRAPRSARARQLSCTDAGAAILARPSRR